MSKISEPAVDRIVAHTSRLNNMNKLTQLKPEGMRRNRIYRRQKIHLQRNSHRPKNLPKTNFKCPENIQVATTPFKKNNPQILEGTLDTLDFVPHRLCEGGIQGGGGGEFPLSLSPMWPKPDFWPLSTLILGRPPPPPYIGGVEGGAKNPSPPLWQRIITALWGEKEKRDGDVNQ